MNNKALLVISFGTTYKDTREKTIKAIEDTLNESFPDRKLYSAFTSSFIRRKIFERDGEKILSVEEALEKMIADGITDVLAVPTHMLSGKEFEKTAELIERYKDRFEHLAQTGPLLEQEEDLEEFADIIAFLFSHISDDRMLVLMGHGSAEMKLPVYELLEQYLLKTGHENYAVGTVEFSPGLEHVIKRIRERKPSEVFITPLLIVAGDHANVDMAGDGPDSWKNVISREGVNVQCIIKGLGEYEEIRKLYVKKAERALLK